MPNKKRITKIDPKAKLSPYLDHQSNKRKKLQKRKHKVSTSLKKLKNERKLSLLRRLGIILGGSLICIIGLGYYISPIANVASVQVKGVSDLDINKMVAKSGIQPKDKVISYLCHRRQLNERLTRKYHEIANVSVDVTNVNQLVLQVKQYPTIGYIKLNNNYRKIVTGGKIGNDSLAWSQVNKTKPLFIGYNHDVSLKKDIQFFNTLPSVFQNKVKLICGNTQRKSQIILSMKDGNVVIGNISTLKNKLRYYDKIILKADKNSLIDLEVGAFSRPLTDKEKKIYNVS